ncbi:unnamed protein product [Spirodela intermedia]|uniref:Uncharacterized protein n=1 Tax=Spirodela intermedia TaxID=51605 RepID=A0ABN7EDL9_SPIIN|nr:unnamed protein product [Spirodela intermedia]
MSVGLEKNQHISMKWVIKLSTTAVTGIAEKQRLAALWQLSHNREELNRGGTRVGPVSRNFILKSTQQEEVLHRIWYALKR